MVKWLIGQNTLTGTSGQNTYYGSIRRLKEEEAWEGGIYVVGLGTGDAVIKKDKSLSEMMAWIEEELNFKESRRDHEPSISTGD